MVLQHLLFALITLYFSFVLGVIVKFINIGIRDATLLLSPFIPLLPFILPIILLVNISSPAWPDDLKEELNRKWKVHKLRFVWKVIVGSFMSFPLVVGMIGEVLHLLKTTGQVKISDETASYIKFFLHRSFA